MNTHEILRLARSIGQWATAIECGVREREYDPLGPDYTARDVNALVKAGVFTDEQRTWAIEYYRRDPGAFWRYVRSLKPSTDCGGSWPHCPLWRRIEALEKQLDKIKGEIT